MGCRTLALTAALLVGCAAVAFAQGWFITVSGSGYTAPDSVGTGYMVSLGAGYRFNPYLAVLAGVGWAQYTIEVETEDGDTENRDVYEIPISAGVRVDLVPDAAVDPFVEAGPEAYLTKVEDEDWTNTWGAYAKGGVRFRIGSVGAIELWVRYSLADFEDTEQYRLTYGLGGSFSGR